MLEGYTNPLKTGGRASFSYQPNNANNIINESKSNISKNNFKNLKNTAFSNSPISP